MILRNSPKFKDKTLAKTHWIVVNADETGSAVFEKKSLAFEERSQDQRVRECKCSDPDSHIDQPVAHKFSRDTEVNG
jgi:hypothetical protein